MSDSLKNRRELDLAAVLSPPADPEHTDLVRRAVLELMVFGGDLNRGEARHILSYWRHLDELTADELLAVVETFKPGEDPVREVLRSEAPGVAVDTGSHWIDSGTGPGYAAPAAS